MESMLSFFETMPDWQKLAWVLLCLCAGWVFEALSPLNLRAYAKARHAMVNGVFMLTTLLVNVAGSLAMGLAAALILEKTGAGRLQLFLMTGVLGGFTTFSAFSLDALALIERGKLAASAAYIGGSVLLSILALVVGLWAGRALA